MFNRFNVLSKNSNKDREKEKDKDNDKGKYDNSWKIVDKKQFILNKSPENNALLDKKKIVKKENKNLKKILCHNIITSGSCGYGNKCLYAHDLSEQNMDNIRKKAYDVLLNNADLSSIDLQKDFVLYRALLALTKMCEQCDKNKCTGGYNCKWGACSKKYHICIRDLNYGDCTHNCGCVHLSDRGLKHFFTTFVKTTNSNVTEDVPGVSGTLLSSDFFKNLYGHHQNNDDGDVLSDITDDSNSENLSDECNQSIFDKS